MELNFEYTLQGDQLKGAVDTIRDLGLAAPSVDALYNSAGIYCAVFPDMVVFF